MDISNSSSLLFWKATNFNNRSTGKFGTLINLNYVAYYLQWQRKNQLRKVCDTLSEQYS